MTPRSRIVSPFVVTLIGVITLYAVTAQGQTTLPNGAVHDYHTNISHPHFRFEPFVFNPLIIDAGVSESDGCPKRNPHWFGRLIERQVWTRHWIAPYPRRWTLTDSGISWVAANLAIDGNLNQVPDFIEFDYNADGHANLSDLSFFADEYGDGKRWGLSDFSALGTIYNSRRAE